MSVEQMREAFERVEKQLHCEFEGDTWKQRGPEGNYLSPFVQMQWECFQFGWKLSREALVVRIDLEEWPTSMASQIQQAIEATGLKVAP